MKYPIMEEFDHAVGKGAKAAFCGFPRIIAATKKSICTIGGEKGFGFIGLFSKRS